MSRWNDLSVCVWERKKNLIENSIHICLQTTTFLIPSYNIIIISFSTCRIQVTSLIWYGLMIVNIHKIYYVQKKSWERSEVTVQPLLQTLNICLSISLSSYLAIYLCICTYLLVYLPTYPIHQSISIEVVTWINWYTHISPTIHLSDWEF